MRKGQYRLPRAEGDAEDAEMAVFHFPGQGGSIQANVDRWISQFSRPDGSPASGTAQVVERQVSGLAVTIVDVSGTYNASMGPMIAAASSRPDYRMLAAIVDTEMGPWFFKLTGPRRTVALWEGSFEQFVNSLKVK